MIRLTRPDGSHFYLNAELIESVEATPDTVIRFGNQRCLLVRETARQVVNQIIRYRRLLSREERTRPTRIVRC